MPRLTVIDHPLVHDKIARLRDVETAPADFRRLCGEVTLLTAYEGLRDLSTTTGRVTTPLTETDTTVLGGEPPALIGILRAGLVMVEAILDLLPEAHVGHLGLQRDEETAIASEYYLKLPPALADREVIVVDPMLATGGSACHALRVLTEHGASRLRLLSIIGCPEGVARVHDEFPQVPITVAALDEGLNEQAYIVPGLGDAGDRMYGTLA